jgi:dolichyl-phosphate-mannose-protein mannosyltransferase
MNRLKSVGQDLFSKTKSFVASFTIFEKLWLSVLLLICLSGFIYIINLDNPMGSYWDETYHISSAQKYRDGVYFNEIHPPLGKLLIALGEEMLGLNNELDTSGFVTVDKIEEFPEGYRFLGVRLFPALIAMLSPIVFFFIAYHILKKVGIALALTSLYLFNNALVLHFRGAMLDGIQMFFVLIALLGFFKVISNPQKPILWLIVMSIGTGLAVATKINSLILAIFWLGVLVEMMWVRWKTLKYDKSIKLNKPFILYMLKPLVAVGSASLISLMLFVSVFAIHYSLFTTVKEQYTAPQSLIQRIGGGLNLQTTVMGIIDWDRYQTMYNENVPKLREGEPGENGSYPMDWIMMRKTIRYRYERYTIAARDHTVYAFDTDKKADVSFDDIDNDPEVSENYVIATKYWYLVGNPISWYLGLLGLILSMALVIGVIIFGIKPPSRSVLVGIITTLVGFWGYMFTVINVGRVLYLYHYFVPLIFTQILLILVIRYLYDVWHQSPNKQGFLSYLIYLFSFFILINFIYFAPFTYGLPLVQSQFEDRNWINFWGMESVK